MNIQGQPQVPPARPRPDLARREENFQEHHHVSQVASPILSHAGQGASVTLQTPSQAPDRHPNQPINHGHGAHTTLHTPSHAPTHIPVHPMPQPAAGIAFIPSSAPNVGHQVPVIPMHPSGRSIPQAAVHPVNNQHINHAGRQRAPRTAIVPDQREVFEAQPPRVPNRYTSGPVLSQGGFFQFVQICFVALSILALIVLIF